MLVHHVEDMCSRIQQCLYFLYRLRVYGVNKNIMLLLYRTTIGVDPTLQHFYLVWLPESAAQSPNPETDLDSREAHIGMTYIWLAGFNNVELPTSDNLSMA